jgi:molybdopterin-guanine dinucleotide biosynthesis protein A
MGTQKAALEWRGSTLLDWTATVLADAVQGPVVVVRAVGQPLPRLPGGVIVVEDPRPGKGPLQGIAAGLTALASASSSPHAGVNPEKAPEAAFVAATDMPFLHRAFVRRVLSLLSADGADVALPVARGHAQPLAAAYRVRLAPLADELVGVGLLRPADLFARCAVSRPDAARLLADPELAAADPGLDSLINVNDPAEYAAALHRFRGQQGSG